MAAPLLEGCARRGGVCDCRGRRCADGLVPQRMGCYVACACSGHCDWIAWMPERTALLYRLQFAMMARLYERSAVDSEEIEMSWAIVDSMERDIYG